MISFDLGTYFELTEDYQVEVCTLLVYLPYNVVGNKASYSICLHFVETMVLKQTIFTDTNLYLSHYENGLEISI